MEKEGLTKLLKKQISEMRVGDSHFVYIPPRDVSLLRSYAQRLNKGHYTFRRYRGVFSESMNYQLILSDTKKASLRGEIFGLLDEGRDSYHLPYHYNKVQKYVSDYNHEHGTAFSASADGVMTIISRNVGMECCKPLVEALNRKDMEAAKEAWKKIGEKLSG